MPAYVAGSRSVCTDQMSNGTAYCRFVREVHVSPYSESYRRKEVPDVSRDHKGHWKDNRAKKFIGGVHKIQICIEDFLKDCLQNIENFKN